MCDEVNSDDEKRHLKTAIEQNTYVENTLTGFQLQRPLAT